jgi:hypothetical protein
MTKFSGSAWFKALPPFPGHRAAFAPTIARLLRNAGLGPASCPTFVDPMCGGVSVAYYAALLGYEVRAGDILPQSAAIARLFLNSAHVKMNERSILKLPDPVVTRQPILSDYAGFLPRNHELTVAHLTGSCEAARDRVQADHLSVMTHHYVLDLLPSGGFNTTARAFAARINAGSFDTLPKSQDAYLKRALRSPTKLLREICEQVSAGMTPTPRAHHSAHAEAYLTIGDAPEPNRSVLFLDPPQPYGKDIRPTGATLAHILTGSRGDIEATCGNKPEDVAEFMGSLLALSTDYRAVLILLDGGRGRNNPGFLLALLSQYRPGAKTTVEAIGQKSGIEEALTEVTYLILSRYE